MDGGFGGGGSAGYYEGEGVEGTLEVASLEARF